MFASEIRKNRAGRLRSGRQWQWHLDEMFVKINGERHYLWRAVDREGYIASAFNGIAEAIDLHVLPQFRTENRFPPFLELLVL